MEMMQAVTPMINSGLSFGVLFTICAANKNMIRGFMFVNWIQIENKFFIYPTIGKPRKAPKQIQKKCKVNVVLGLYFYSKQNQEKSLLFNIRYFIYEISNL